MNSTSAPPKLPRLGTQSIERALLLARLIAGHGRRGIRIKDLTLSSGISATTVHRIVQSLIREGVIERDEHTHKLYLGATVHQLGMVARPAPLGAMCREALDGLLGLARGLCGVVYLSDRAGFEAVCLDRRLGEGSSDSIGWALHVGTRNPLGLGVGGLAILSALDKATAEDVLRTHGPRYDRHPGLNQETVRNEVVTTRARGFAQRNSVLVPGVAAFSMAFDYGSATGSVTVATMQWQLRYTSTERILVELQRARERLAHATAG